MSSNTTWDKNVFVFGPRNLVGSSTEVAVFFRIIFGNINLSANLQANKTIF